MSVSIRDPRFPRVVGPSVLFEQIATGCLFTEGPLWHPREHYLLWSDMPGDHLRRWSAKDGVSTFRKPCNMSNGLAWDRQGRLLACEHASSQVTRTEPDGRITPMATHYQGKQLNSPNDIVCGADGGIYFSDPPYGRAASTRGEAPLKLYARAFAAFSEILPAGAYAAAVLPNEAAIAVAEEHLELVERHALRVHRSLTRNFCAFVKRH